jgi:plastocyanin
MRLGEATIIGAVAAAAAAGVLGGCGDDGDGTSAGDADLTVVAEDSLEFDRDSYTASAGEIAVSYENAGNLTHTLLVEGIDDFKLTVGSTGDTDTGSVELEPGEYRLYCDVPGHEAMEATLTVE